MAKEIGNARRVEIEAAAAQSLLLNLRDILADDQETAADMIEGSTNLLEALDAACARLGAIKGLCAGLDGHMEKLKARKDRLEDQAEVIRAALHNAVAAYREATGKASVELPSGTLTLKRVPPALRIINDADIPAEFYKPQDPKLDRKALTDAVKVAEQKIADALKADPEADVSKLRIPGCEMSNGSETLQVR